jgi:hypothetical protein
MKQLSTKQIKRFIPDGFIKIEHAFPSKLAEQCRNYNGKSTYKVVDTPFLQPAFQWFF